MAASRDPRNQRASLKDSSVESSSGMQRASPHKAVPTAHVTFLIDCATGKQVSLAASTGPPQARRANQGRATPPMKTFVMFCGKNPLPGRPLDGAKDNSPPCTGLGAPDSLKASRPGPQNDPKAKESSLKAGAPEKQSTREKVKHSLKALSGLCRPVE